jgi:transcriptional regulator with XRE-family HTH domain
MLRVMKLSNASTRSTRRAAGRPNRRLQELRINEGLSPNVLAYRAGVSGNTVRMAEAGFRPSPRTQFAIAGVFGLRPLDLWPIEEQA